MKNTLFILSIVFSFATTSYGQIGLKLGVHSFDISAPRDIVFPDDNQVSFKDAGLGFQGGIYGRIHLGGIFLEPRVMLHSTNVEYSINGDNGGLVENVTSETFNNLDIPFLVGFDFLFLDILVGPVAHIHLNSTSDLWDLAGYEERFDTAEYGWRGGIGLTVGNINVGLEYEGNFSNFGDHITLGGQQFSFGKKPSRILLNLGVMLF